MARLYRPRMHATLVVAGNADASILTRVELTPRQLSLLRNDNNHADEARLTVDWIDAGVDPRLLAASQVKIYVGEADDFDHWTPDDAENLRFVGILSRARRRGADGERQIDLEFLDYTALFLRAKPFAAKGVPRLDQNLKQAWSTLLSGFTDSAYQNEIKFLLNAIEFRGVASPGPVIGQAVSSRFRGKGQVQVGTNVDAWAVWQQVVGMVGLLSYFERDKLVVTTADAHYGGQTAEDRPVFRWGFNVLEFDEERNNAFEKKGVGITSFDPETGKALEAVWPEGAKTTKGKSKKVDPDSEVRGVDYFAVPSVTDEPTLLEIAKRVYAERARQEFTGRLRTAELVIERESGVEMSVLDLVSGDSLRLILDEFDELGAAALLGAPDAAQRKAYFERLGYDPQIAGLLAARADDLLRLRSEFYVKSVATHLETTEDGGRFEVDLEYINKITTTGDARTE